MACSQTCEQVNSSETANLQHGTEPSVKDFLAQADANFDQQPRDESIPPAPRFIVESNLLK